MLGKYFVDKFIFYQINCLLIDIFYLKLSYANFDCWLRISVPYSEYKGKRIQGKYGYLCLTPNAPLHIAGSSARDALRGMVVNVLDRIKIFWKQSDLFCLIKTQFSRRLA